MKCREFLLLSPISKHRGFHLGCRVLAGLLALFGCPIEGFSQGSLQVTLRTGEPGAGRVQQRIIALGTSPVSAGDRVEFDFGLASEEPIGPGFVMDSFSVGLQDSRGGSSAVLLLMDVNGIFVAPHSAGSLPLDAAGLRLTSISSPSPDSGLPQGQAFHMSVPVPSGLLFAPLRVMASLYDNQDDFRSVAWLGNLVVVPEPSVGTVSGGLALAWCASRRQRAPIS